MATPFPFVAGAVLTAANLNAITELVTNTQTDDYTLAATDAGDRVIANKATAITFTVPNSVFTAAQIVRVHNVGAGTLTLSAGAGLTLNGADVLTLSQYQGGELFFTSASSAIFFPTAKTVSSGALTFVSGATFSAASSVAVDSVFTSTYQNYRVIFIVSGSATATGDTTLQYRTGGSTNTTSNYTRGLVGIGSGGSFDGNFSSGGTSFNLGSTSSSEANYVISLDVFRPQEATLTNAFVTTMPGYGSTTPRYGTLQFTAATAFDGFIVSRSAGTMSGNYRVYGYSNS